MDAADEDLLGTLNKQRAMAARHRLHWSSYEDSLKQRILNVLDIDRRDPVKRRDVVIPDVVTVEIQAETHLDQSYLRTHYPQIYEECRRVHYKVYFK